MAVPPLACASSGCTGISLQESPRAFLLLPNFPSHAHDPRGGLVPCSTRRETAAQGQNPPEQLQRRELGAPAEGEGSRRARRGQTPLYTIMDQTTEKPKREPYPAPRGKSDPVRSVEHGAVEQQRCPDSINVIFGAAPAADPLTLLIPFPARASLNPRSGPNKSSFNMY